MLTSEGQPEGNPVRQGVNQVGMESLMSRHSRPVKLITRLIFHKTCCMSLKAALNINVTYNNNNNNNNNNHNNNTVTMISTSTKHNYVNLTLV